LNKQLYLSALAAIAAGMLFTHEGRTAKDKRDLDWMAEKVYGVPPEEVFEWQRAYESGEQPEPQEPAERSASDIEARRQELLALTMKELAPVCEHLGLPEVKPGMSKASVVEGILEAEFPEEEE
jgi:hypothetical protein